MRHQFRGRFSRFDLLLGLQFGLLLWLVAFEGQGPLSNALDLTGVIIPLFAIGLATRRTRDRRIAIALAAAAMLFSGGALGGLRPGNVEAGPLLAAVFAAFATWVMLADVVRAREVTRDVLTGALAGYIMAGLAFAVVFGVIQLHRPDAFAAASGAATRFPDLVYFSFVTLLTIGFGDVAPVAPMARAAVLAEGLFGVVFTTVVMAALMAGYLRHRERGGTP
jgi:hypothetical protein